MHATCMAWHGSYLTWPSDVCAVSFVEVRLAFLGTSVFTLQSATLASINCDAGVPVECAFACPVTEQGQKIQVGPSTPALLMFNALEIAASHGLRLV